MTRWGCVAVLGALSFAHMAAAQSVQDSAAAPPTVTSHTGFFARLTVGFGGSRIAASSDDASLGGVAAVYDLAIGYSLRPRLAVHASYFGARAMAPTLQVDGHEVEPEDGAESSLNGVGVGLTYYLPSNLYLSPALGLGIIEGVDARPAKRDVLNAGFAVGLTVGYEWMLGGAWGLGAAASGYYFRAQDKDGPTDQAWQGFAFGPSLSVTYN